MMVVEEEKTPLERAIKFMEGRFGFKNGVTIGQLAGVCYPKEGATEDTKNRVTYSITNPLKRYFAKENLILRSIRGKNEQGDREQRWCFVTNAAEALADKVAYYRLLIGVAASIGDTDIKYREKGILIPEKDVDLLRTMFEQTSYRAMGMVSSEERENYWRASGNRLRSRIIELEGEIEITEESKEADNADNNEGEDDVETT